ncbi:MAG: hypothetical protein ACRDU0_16185, partial [Mycobacterium sp.]
MSAADLGLEEISLTGAGREPDRVLAESMARHGLLVPVDVRAEGAAAWHGRGRPVEFEVVVGDKTRVEVVVAVSEEEEGWLRECLA